MRRRTGVNLAAQRALSVQPVDAATIDFEHAETQLPQVRRKILQEIRHYAGLRDSTHRVSARRPVSTACEPHEDEHGGASAGGASAGDASAGGANAGGASGAGPERGGSQSTGSQSARSQSVEGTMVGQEEVEEEDAEVDARRGVPRKRARRESDGVHDDTI